MTNAKAWVAAIWGFVTGVVGSLTVVLVGEATLQALTQGQWLAVIAAGLAGFGGGFGLTWSVSNRPAPVTEAQAAEVLNKYVAPVSGGDGNGDITSA